MGILVVGKKRLGSGGGGITKEQENKLNNAVTNTTFIAHSDDKSNPHEVKLSQLRDVKLVSLSDGQVLLWDATNQVFINGEMTGGTDGEKVKLTSDSAEAKYLSELIDNSTIEVDTANGVLYATSIKDQVATVTEINFLSGLASNVQEQINNLGKSMSMYGVFDTKTLLLAQTTPVPTDGATAIVISDETNSNKQMTYIYVGTTKTWTKVAENSISVRDFTVNPINLATEVTGTLNKGKIDVAIARLADVLDKATYQSSYTGVVKSAETLRGLTVGVGTLNSLPTNSHTHTNKTLLDAIISTGLGNKFLANNGTYKELVVQSSTPPTDTYCIWIDNTEHLSPILKISDGSDWIAVSSASSSGGGSNTNMILMEREW